MSWHGNATIKGKTECGTWCRRIRTRTCVRFEAGNAGRVRTSVGDNTITDILADHKIAPGDVFSCRTVYSIGAGSFIAEIQQTSNITYRIYDFNRRDANGTRELHTELAKGAIDHTVLPDYRTLYGGAGHARGAGCVPLFHHVAYDSTRPETLDSRVARTRSSWRSRIEAAGITDDSGAAVPVHQGETVTIPASAR